MCVFFFKLLLGAGVLGDSLGTLADGVLGQFSGKEQTNGGLDFPTGDGATLVVVSQARGFGGNAFENVVDEAVHDAHGLGADSGVGMHLFQHFVDVDGIRFLPPLLLLFLVRFGDIFLGFSRLLRCFTGSLWRHFERNSVILRKNRSWIIITDAQTQPE